MPGKFEMPRNGRNQPAVDQSNESRPPVRRRRKYRRKNYIPIIAAVILIAVLALILTQCFGGSDHDTDKESESTNDTSASEETDTTADITPKISVVSSAAVSAQGDLLMHKPIITAYTDSDGNRNFDPIFRYLTDTLENYDYSIANLETTLGGTEYPYQGNPRFNCPDEFADAVAGAGFDMLLTANNHSSDTYTDGILRTAEKLREKGIDTLGTQLNNEEKKYAIVDLNGIRVGMLCYTYATNENGDGYPSLNFKEFVTEPGIVNYFTENDLDQFYTEVETHLSNMASDGAEATMLFIHWGEEYDTEENATQRIMAQKLCDLGVDVIVGGHPHVVQPVDLLESSIDPSHKTVCIYSVGNAVSNQVKEADEAFASGHSEDGALFEVTFEKYSNGNVEVSTVDVLPTWVIRYEDADGIPTAYHILPLDISREAEWQELYSLTDQDFAYAQDSYKRTMDIVGEGLAECRDYLEQYRQELLNGTFVE